MAARKNPFSKATKKAEREAKKEKAVADLRKSVAQKHRDALAAEKAIETHDKTISASMLAIVKADKDVQTQGRIFEALQKKLEAAKAKMLRLTVVAKTSRLKTEKLKLQTVKKQHTCDVKFKMFNNAEDKLARMTRLHLPKDM